METTQEAVLVTGGASGIGLAVVRGCWTPDAGAGGRPFAGAAGRHGRYRAARELGRVRLDVSDEAQVVDAGAAGERFRADRRAGQQRRHRPGPPFLDTETAALRRMLEVNLVGSFVVAREVARRMRKRGHGSIVNITSVSGIRGNAGRAAYGASKGGGDADARDGGRTG